MRRKEFQAIETQEELAELMRKGDPSCSIPLQGRVMKTNSHSSDNTPDGSKGTVVGSLAMSYDVDDLTIENMSAGINPGVNYEMYLVQWDHTPDELPTFIANINGRIIQI